MARAAIPCSAECAAILFPEASQAWMCFSQKCWRSVSTGIIPCIAHYSCFIINVERDGNRIRKTEWGLFGAYERLWRSVKYEEVYLHAYDTVSDSRDGIGRYFDLYNQRRPHSSLGRSTPDDVYFSQQSLTLAA